MKKKLFAMLLAVLLVVTSVVPAAAEELQGGHISMEEMEEAMAAMSGAVEDMGDVFTPAEATNIIDLIKNSLDTFKTVGSFLTPINGSVTFLKMIGAIKDQNKEMLKSIMTQLQAIGEQLTDMDRKLDDLTVQMSAMQASAEFNTRTEKAILMRSNWNDFERSYMEDGMDSLLAKYNSKMLNGMQNWCKNPSGRVVNGTDNTQIVLLYTPDKDGYALQYVTENGIPADVSKDTRYLVLGSDVLPGAMSWNVNTYRKSIQDTIIANVKARLADPEGAPFTAANFPEFAEGGTVTDELLQAVAEDAVNVLVYRAAAAEVNKEAEFSVETVRQFTNYCTHLLRSGEGLDAMLKAMYLTHSFESEIADDLTAFCDEMTLKTGAYGALALNVVGMSDFITDEEKLNVLDTYVHTLNSIEQNKKNGLTGNGNYCYLTNSILSFGELEISSAATVITMHRSSIVGYRDMSGKAASTEITYDKYRTTYDTSKLIGDADALLLEYMLSANGEKFGFDYLNSHLGGNRYGNYGSTVVSMVGEQNMAMNDTTPLYTTKLIGNWFTNGSTISMSSRPSKAGEAYMSYRKKVVGSLVDNTSGSLSANKTLSALAIFGESNWYWEKDESAIMGGPNNVTSFSHSCSSRVTDVEFPSDEIITHSYSQSVVYNCLIELPLNRVLSGQEGENPLSSYLVLLDEIREEEEPVVPEDTEPEPPANPSDDPKDKKFEDSEEEPAEEQAVGLALASDVPSTGDAGALWLWVALLALAGLLLTKLFFKKKD